MKNKETISLLEVLQAGTSFLKKHQVEQPRLQTEYLLAHVLKIPRLELYMQFERLITESERAPLRDLIKRRGQGTPLQHLLGTTEFFGRVFSSDASALIPRPETEQLVEKALSYKDKNTILDVGTGSGVIAITLALEKKTAVISAIDLSSDALSLAQKNAQRHNVTNIIWHQGDLFSALPNNDEKFDLIIANLPYIPTEEISRLEPEVQHDPVMALDGGSDGLKLITRLIEQAPSYLSQGGHLLLEIGKNQDIMVMDYLAKNHYQEILALSDYQGVLRFIEAVKF